ncbi:MAG: SRPBCC domain-containing protein [Bacteroidetes bacterium]|nr:SRPBCC domain-containing protein [Bacteroidota bacterium]
MEMKTKIHAEDGKQELFITREFDLSVEDLFTAYTEPEIVEQWMGTKVVQMENKRFGFYQFVTTDPKGNNHVFCGTIHEFVPNEKITRTFEMGNTPFPVQLEYLVYEKLTPNTSKLTMQVIYKTVEHRNQILQMPFAQGINWAHNRLEEITKSKNISR